MLDTFLEVTGEAISALVDFFLFRSMTEWSVWRKAFVYLSLLATLVIVVWWVGGIMRWW
ncbi:MAG: hypothetical protein KF805_10100 [Phycisphaeraceae bacterium]|nr:hypothetical protein [Phycisphaeraceae bacterium]